MSDWMRTADRKNGEIAPRVVAETISTISLVPCGFCYEGRETEPVTLHDGRVKWLCPKCRRNLAENPILCQVCKQAPRWIEGQGTTCGCGGLQAYERKAGA